MNDERLEPLITNVDNDKFTRMNRKREDEKRIRSSSFTDSLDDISSDNSQEYCSVTAHRTHRRQRRRGRPSTGTDGSDNEMEVTVTIKRDVQIPDEIRVSRSLRLPEFGPKILFFSGGTAIRDLSSCLINYTHNSIHIITPFDSGGSSAEIRRGFDMLSVGDIRNRLLALSDKNEPGIRSNPQIIEFFGHRLVKTEGFEAAEDEFLSILDGSHKLIRAVELPMRSILKNHLRWFFDRMPADFDLRGASIGNLIITGCFLEHNRDIVTAIFMVAKLLGVKGFCRPLTAANLHIRTLYADGTELVGQHLMNSTPKTHPHTNASGSPPCGMNGQKIEKIDLVKELKHSSDARRQESQSCHIDMLSSDLVSSAADLICFPMGSFFGSIVVNLLPMGVGRAISERHCPKVYIPNTGLDPEMTGRTLAECVSLIIDMVRADPCHGDGKEEVPIASILNFVLLDTANCEYCVTVDKMAIQELGVTVIDIPLVDIGRGDFGNNEACADQGKRKMLDPKRVVEVLVSLSS